MIETESAAGVESHEFDYVAVCSGQAHIPKETHFPGTCWVRVRTNLWPEIHQPRILHISIPTGEEHFKGGIRHSSFMKQESDLDIYEGKRVLCVGGGESASDVAMDVSKRASSTHIALRNPVLVLPRNLWGIPPDYTEPRSLFFCPRFVRWATYKASMLTLFFFNNCWARDYQGKTLWVPNFKLHWWCLFSPKFFKENLAFERTPCSSIQVRWT